MGIFKRNQSHRVEHSEPRPSLSFISPYRVMSVRKFWLVFMFLLGAVSHFLLAIYVPEVWNYLYGLIQNFMPEL